MLAEWTITSRISLVAELDDAAQALDELRRGGIHAKPIFRIGEAAFPPTGLPVSKRKFCCQTTVTDLTAAS